MCCLENANKWDASTIKLKITTIQHSWKAFQWRKTVLSFDTTLVVVCKVELLWSFEVQGGVGRREVPASNCTLKIENLKTLFYLVLLRKITFVRMTEFIIINKQCPHTFYFIEARNFLVGEQVFEPQNLYTHARTHKQKYCLEGAS